MKRLNLIFNLILLSSLIYGQNGTYRCNDQRFEDENNPSNNKEHNNSMIITVDINDYTGGFILVSMPGENISYKWDILKKIDTSVKSDTKTAYSQYDARFNVSNVPAIKQSIVVLIQDMNNNSFHIAIYNPDSRTTNWYHNLTKVTQ